MKQVENILPQVFDLLISQAKQRNDFNTEHTYSLEAEQLAQLGKMITFLKSETRVFPELWQKVKQCSTYHCLLKLLHEDFPDEAYQYIKNLSIHPSIYEKYFESSIPYKKLFFARKALELKEFHDNQEIKNYTQQLEKEIREEDLKTKVEIPTFLGPVEYFPSSYLPFYLVPKNRILYKGTKSPCENFNSNQTLAWFGSKPTAHLYAEPYLCSFQTKQPLRLMQPTNQNLQKLLFGHQDIKLEDQKLANAIFGGKEITCGQTLSLFDNLGIPISTSMKQSMQRHASEPSGQCSLTHLDAQIGNKMCLNAKPYNLDGYIDFGHVMPWYQGKNKNFHDEIMLCDPHSKVQFIPQVHYKVI